MTASSVGCSYVAPAPSGRRSYPGRVHREITSALADGARSPHLGDSTAARLRAPHPLQHVLDRARWRLRALRVARAQHHVGVGPVLRIEERIAADRDVRDWPWRSRRAGCRCRLRAQSARTVWDSMRMPVLSLGATSSSMACMIDGTPAMTMTLPSQKPGAPETLLTTRSAPLGIRVMRMRASFISRAGRGQRAPA